MSPEVKKMRQRINKEQYRETNVKCMNCGAVVRTARAGQFRKCRCGDVAVLQHLSGKYQILCREAGAYTVLKESRELESNQT